MISACHKGFALTRNEFYWGQISSYLNTSLPPEVQGNYFAVTVHFSLAVIWEATCEMHCSQKLVTALLKKADQSSILLMVKSRPVQILLSISTDWEFQGSCAPLAVPPSGTAISLLRCLGLAGASWLQRCNPSAAQHHPALWSAPHWDKGENWKMSKHQNCWVDIRTV